MGVFCSVNFGRSIYSSQRNVSGFIEKLVQRRIQNQKDFLIFVFFEDLSRVEVLCEHGIFVDF